MTRVFSRNQEGISLTNPDGLNMGIQFDKGLNEYISFIGCRRNGIPVGPERAWHLDGTRYYYNLWSRDGRGVLLDWKVWQKDGSSNCAAHQSICAICSKKIQRQDSAVLNCLDEFHYDCICEWMNRSKKTSECPTCDTEICCATTPQNQRWLCRAIARNFAQNLVLVQDIFGNKAWLKFQLQTNLPNFHSAPNVEITDAKLLDSLPTISTDRNFNVMCIKTSLGKVYMGNVTPLFETQQFDFEFGSLLMDCSLVGDPRLVQVIKQDAFY